MNNLEPRHKRALQKAYQTAVESKDKLTARYLREALAHMGVTLPKAKVAVRQRHVPSWLRPVRPSAQLAAIIGANPLPRTEIVSKLWSYIKKNNLQDAVNKRMVNCDDQLKAVTGKAEVSMFELAGLIGKHLS